MQFPADLGPAGLNRYNTDRAPRTTLPSICERKHLYGTMYNVNLQRWGYYSIVQLTPGIGKILSATQLKQHQQRLQRE